MTLSARLLVKEDQDSLDAFLKPHTPFAYFMRSNLMRRGIIFDNKAYHAEYFGAFDQERLIGVLSHSWMGSVQVFAPDGRAIPCLAGAWRDRQAAQARRVECFLGPVAQVEALLARSGVGRDRLRDAAPEDLFTLSLDRLAHPDLLDRPTIKVRRADNADTAFLIPWRHDYYVEALGDAAGEETLNKAQTEIVRRIGDGDLFVLEAQGVPVSFCGAGGFLPDWKIIGPVWTPPDLRGKGYGRAITAGALELLREAGATHAVLFARDAPAIKAYRAIGFERVGDWRLDFLINPILRL